MNVLSDFAFGRCPIRSARLSLGSEYRITRRWIQIATDDIEECQIDLVTMETA
jgi:hypothetical protein